ncbi:ABC transporter permease [Methylobacterium sp. J-078]|jgi:simple sugar transport system permease protein|uniref:ABC transporter permease n=1 Tax=Methylobacterium sp. J-078 TaxID=2836657 RepID=UPI001FB8EE22|nr:ABC transporter permease [Methylobacterium sp. J-078]MCJ2043881.1 ABC transporter permease [Methylobacterium sp. J-078]
MSDFIVNWLANVPAFALPYALAALGLIITEKAGVLSLGAEGFLLVGAMSGIGVLLGIGDHPALALVVAAFSAALLSLVYALLVVTLRVNQVIGGLALVFLAQGMTGVIATRAGWTNRPVDGLQPVPLGGLGEVPVLGPILFQHDILVFAAVPLVALVAHVLGRTMFGLRLRAVGDGPDAADAAGIGVAATRYGAIALGAALVGLAGGYLSVGVAKIWVEGMSGGRGWIAVALVIFARWQPWRALAGALLFGGIEALIPRIAAIGVALPQYLVLMTPYLATLAVMIWICLRHDGTSLEPRALGIAHMREERR